MNNELREEAIKRIKILQDKYKLDNKMLELYEKEEVFGVDNSDLDEDNYDMIGKMIIDFKKEFNTEVYYYIISKMFKTDYVVDIFYVSSDKETWEEFRTPKDDLVYVCSINLSMGNYREFGYIKIREENGRLKRIA